MVRHSHNRRDFLLRDVEKRLLQVFIKNGFTASPLTEEDQRSPEIRQAFPLGILKRKNDKTLEIAEVQFDKYGRARFVINFGVVPEGGVTLPWTRIAQEEADVSALSESYRLYSRAIYPSWFGVGPFSKETDENLKKVVDKAIELYPEMEAWFSTKVVGRHTRECGFGPIEPRPETQ